MDPNDMMAGPGQTIRLGDREYWLTPMAVGEQSARQSRSLRSELQLITDPRLSNMKEFTYDPLLAAKRVRLLQLSSGTTYGPEIFCKLIEADYDNSFHILTEVMGEEREDDRMRAEEEEEKKEEKKDKEKGLTDEEISNAKLRREWYRVKKRELKYEALSWCWGIDPPLYAVQVMKKDGTTYKKSVKHELALALKYLRLPDKTRTLWIDAICINQDDPEERNRQVQMMSRIYTRSKEVCIWLGPDDDQSKLAIDFIHKEIMELKNFDTICSDKRYNPKWHALMMLMQRDWFSRRWVVQEIALASKAKVYCGPDSIPWKEFAVAVELFVEVETATHRLSEVMKKDEKYQHVPGWFEYVSELGASLLVQATGRVFRAQRTPLADGSGDIETFEELREITRDVNTIDPLDRRSLLSLEYLVSTMFIFKATEPRDAVYALLAVARDAAPFARPSPENQDRSFLIMSLFADFLEEKPFIVDYSRPYSDVCRDFVEFVIRRKARSDPVQALDILCRPWALESQGGTSIRLPQKAAADSKDEISKPPTKPWITRDENKPWKKRRGKIEKKERDDKTVYYEHVWENESINEDDWEDCGQDDFAGNLKKYWKKFDGKKDWNEIGKNENWGSWEVPGRFKKVMDHLKGEPKKEDSNGTVPAKKEGKCEPKDKDTPLPNWIARASQAPFSLYQHPGMNIQKTGRANADPLVGQPQDGHRNYGAAQTKGVELKELKFRKRPKLGHYSIYVTGFVLDEVDQVRDASQGGNIPKSWLDMGEWTDYTKDPPDKLWRTLVADRGRDNRNPPYYYARACKESVHKGGITSGRVNTTALINNERNSIVAEFCRRVHAVIWNRCLFTTTGGKLGLGSNVQKGDKVCILYGCTVPVILREHTKTKTDLEKEKFEDQIEALKSCYVRMVEMRQRKARAEKALQKLRSSSEEEYRKLLAARERANFELNLMATERKEKQAAEDTRTSKREERKKEEEEEEKDRKAAQKRKQEDDNKHEEPEAGNEMEMVEEHGKHMDESKPPTDNVTQESEKKKKKNKRKKKTKGERTAEGLRPLDEVASDMLEGEAGASASQAPSVGIGGEEDEDQSSSDRSRGPAAETTKDQSADGNGNGKPGGGVDGVNGANGKAGVVEPEKLEDKDFFYDFNGEAYIHGMMDGEALRDKFYQQVSERIFELR